MIFNSYTYLVLFLPVALLGFLFAARRSPRTGFGWLVLCSLIYYGCWNPDPARPWTPWYVALIIGSCFANFHLGTYISRHRGSRRGKICLTSGVVANLLLLGYYKYTGFLGNILQDLTGWPTEIPSVVLALGISFFTFQQIAYLVDAWRGETEEYHIIDYFLFVCFWPQLIAGPIVHHKEMLPQFQRESWRHHRHVNFSSGLTILLLGLFKKVVIADNLAPAANSIFSAAAGDNHLLSMPEAWLGALAYAGQIYFDFSGYTDMAIGSARLFGIRLPLNFHSPYKATSIIEFWRRWHITLSRFLRDYLYIPLGGNRMGSGRRYTNLLLTMALGGLWHGAGWTYLLWGMLHGLFLCINHGWLHLRKTRGLPALPAALAGGLTFLGVLIAWVPFRAGSLELGATGSTSAALGATRHILGSMFGFHGFAGSPGQPLVSLATPYVAATCLAIAACWLLPNTQQFMRRYSPAIDPSGFRDFALGPRRWWQWRPTRRWFFFSLALLLVTLGQFDKVSEFIYFQF